jgi:hypothetical protein
MLKDKPKKTKLISTICSNKKDKHTIHEKRFNFTEKLIKEIPELERFGRGFNFVEHKHQALDNYKFSIAIENHQGKNMWSEKLADVLLSYGVPIYYGCSNVYDFFPKDAVIEIDINNIDESINKIKKIIHTKGEYERRLPAVKKARKMIMEQYNLIPMLVNIIENDKMDNKLKKTGKKIISKNQMRLKHPTDFLQNFTFKLNNSLKNII